MSPVPQHAGKLSGIQRTVRNSQPDRGGARAEVDGDQGYVGNAVRGKSPVTTGQSRPSTVSRLVGSKGGKSDSIIQAVNAEPSGTPRAVHGMEIPWPQRQKRRSDPPRLSCVTLVPSTNLSQPQFTEFTQFTQSRSNPVHQGALRPITLWNCLSLFPKSTCQLI